MGQVGEQVAVEQVEKWKEFMKKGEKPVQGVQSLETVTEEGEKNLNLGVENGESLPEDWTVKAIGNLAKNRQKKYVEISYEKKSLGRCLLDTEIQRSMCSLKLLQIKSVYLEAGHPFPIWRDSMGQWQRWMVFGMGSYGQRRDSQLLRHVLNNKFGNLSHYWDANIAPVRIKWDFGENRVMLPKDEGELNNLSLHKTKNG